MFGQSPWEKGKKKTKNKRVKEIKHVSRGEGKNNKISRGKGSGYSTRERGGVSQEQSTETEQRGQ